MRKGFFLLSTPGKIYIPLTALLALIFTIGGEGPGTLWGLPLSHEDTALPIRAFFQWQLLTVPPLLLASDHLSNWQTMEVFIRIRINNDLKWYWSFVCPCIAAAALWGLSLACLAELLAPIRAWQASFLLMALGQGMWVSLYIVIFFAGKSVTTALVGTILLMGVLFYVGEFFPMARFSPSSWTMVSRTNLWDSQGILVGRAMVGCTVVSGLSIGMSIIMEQIRRVWL